MRDAKIQRVASSLARDPPSARGAVPQRQGQSPREASLVPHLLPGMHHSGGSQKGKQGPLQGGMAGLGDLLDEGVKEREHRWSPTFWLGTRVGIWIPGGAGCIWVSEAHPSGDAYQAYAGVGIRRNVQIREMNASAQGRTGGPQALKAR